MVSLRIYNYSGPPEILSTTASADTTYSAVDHHVIPGELGECQKERNIVLGVFQISLNIL